MVELHMNLSLEPKPELAVNWGGRIVADSPLSRTGCQRFDKLEQRDIIPLGCETLRATEVHWSNPSRGPCTRAPTSFTLHSASKELYSTKVLTRSALTPHIILLTIHLFLGLGESGCYRWGGQVSQPTGGGTNG